jgi:uncharacterized repeat protein (TIGR03803 family)
MPATNKSSGWRISAVAWIIAMIFLLQPGQAAERQALHGHVPAVVAHLQSTGRLPGTTNLNLAIALPLRNKEGLQNLLQQIYDPASPNYRHYMTSAQFAEQFGPTEKDYQALVAFAKANGLTVSGTHPNRALLDVRGSVTDIEKNFRVKMHTYKHPTEERTFYAPDVEPSLDLAVPVLHISGLDSYWQPQPRFKATRNAGAHAGPHVGSGPGGDYMGNDFRAAYVPGSALTGAGQTVGLLQFDGYTSNDIAYYEATNGLPNVMLTNVLLDGFDGTPTGYGGEVEVSLDIEMVISMAPGVSNVIVYEAGPYGLWHDILNRMATDNLAKQLSCSWYTPGGGADLVADGIFQQMAAQGQSFFNASGDDDAYTALIDFPGDTPYITQVGGTTLTTDGAGGPYSSETVWNWGRGIGSGGGVSTYYTIPSWQQGLDMASSHGSTTMRNTPDVALTADNVYVRADGMDYGGVGGTSCAAPLWAGFTALMNQQNGEMPVGFLNPALYAIAKREDYTNCFHDITIGNNYSPSSPTNFPAVAGYDLCTGLGTPAGGTLIDALTEPLQIAPAKALLFTGPVGGPFGPVGSVGPIAQSYSLHNTGTNALNWTLVNPTFWLTASPTNGTIPAGGSADTVTVSVTLIAGSFSAGSYDASLTFTNLNDNYGQTRPVSLAVVTLPVVTLQPTNQAVLEGAPAAFAVETASNALMFYRWWDNGVNLADNGNISGSTTTNLAIASVSPADVGAYSVVASNAAGVAVSSNALLTIVPSIPVFTAQPTNQTALPGQAVTFTVATIGTHPFSYRWRDNGTNLIDSGNISGSAGASLTLSNVSAVNIGTYSVAVSNSLGTAISSNISLDVVSVTAPGVTLARLYSFGVSDGEYPCSPLAQGADGNFYGTTVEGGTNGGYGTIFQMTTNGVLTTLVSFGSTDGAHPYAGLMPGKDGNFYGTTSAGGTNDNGTVFRVTTNGMLTTLVSFNDTNGSFSVAGLMQTSDGNLYGTTLYGGTHGMGTIFRMTTNGALTNLVSFDRIHGSYPSAVLIQGADGNLYGTTENGGTDDCGTAFRAATNGVLKTLASFDYTNSGAYPVPGLVQDADGSLFGTTLYGGTNYGGTVFKITPAGTLITMYSFAGGGDGGYPFGGLLLSSDGNLYGTTEGGGSYDYGTAFRLAPNGSLFTLADFDGYQGLYPRGALIQSADGNFYGTTEGGGAGYTGSDPGYGAIFQLDINVPLQITSQPLAQSAFMGANVTLSVAASGTMPLHYQWQKDGTSLHAGGNLSGFAARTLIITNVTPDNAGTYCVVVNNALGSVVSSNAILTITSSSPIITMQPASQTVLPGGMAAFPVQAVGNVPLFYQWRFNSTNMTGATNVTLILTGVTTNQAGNYSVVVSNAVGSATSSNAVLKVITNAVTALTTFDDLPHTDDGLAVPVGYNGLNWDNFYYFDAVNYSGNPSGYGTGVVSPSNVAFNAYGSPASISSAASFSLFSAYLTAAWTSNLQVEVMGYAGDTLSYDNTYTLSTNTPTLINFNYLGVNQVQFISADNSQIVVDDMTVVAEPAIPQITSQPADLTVRAGGTAVFNVAALGTEPLSYFWRRNGTPIPGANGITCTTNSVQLSDSGSTFSCLVSNVFGMATSQVATLTVTTKDYFTELFDPSSNHVNDLSYKMLTFTPDGSTNFYNANCDSTNAFPSTTNGIALSLGDDDSVAVNLVSGAQVWLYGVSYTTLHVGSNGYITFGSGDTQLAESFVSHFSRPRISALFDDLNPHSSGTVTWTQLVDRAVVTFQNVPEFGTSDQNSFQYELFFNGVVRLTFLGIAAKDGLAGLSRGMGVPSDLVESDLTSYGPYCGTGSGSLSASGVAGGTNTIDLTVEGTDDWAHWGFSGTGIDHKSVYGSAVDNIRETNIGSPLQYANNANGFSWADGTPTVNAVATTTGIYIVGAGNGFTITVPADTAVRTLKVYAGGWMSAGTLTAHLSDNSAAYYIDSSFSNNAASYYVVYTITYKAGVSNQNLAVNWQMASGPPGGNVTIQAATLRVDTTARGTPISWLQSHGFSSHFDMAELTDWDGDGAQAWEEYIAGTDPANSNSVLKVGIKRFGSGIVVSFPSLSASGTDYDGKTRYYDMQTATNLFNSAWLPVTNETNIGGANVTVNYTNAVPDWRRYYRVGTRLQ